MTSVNLKKSMAYLALSALVAGGIGLACGKGSSRDDGAGGSDEDDGGNGGEAGGTGGSTGGKGGGGAGGGTGGSMGGSGGVMIATRCSPGTNNKGGVLGPSVGWGGPNLKDPAPQSKRVKFTDAGPLANTEIWLPVQYEAAESNKVAIMFVSNSLDTSRDGDGKELPTGTLQDAVDRLTAAGHMPPTILFFSPVIDWGLATNASGSNATSRADTLGAVFTALKAKYPKLSSDAKMHAVVGQSTAGAVAFDLAWAKPDLIGKVVGASASFVGFQQWLFPYQNKVDGSKKDQIRFAFDVGECDLVWEEPLIPATCSVACRKPANPSDPHPCICQGCGEGNWVEVNKTLTNKLIDLGYKGQLLIRRGITHNLFLGAMYDNLTFLWRDVVCPNGV